MLIVIKQKNIQVKVDVQWHLLFGEILLEGDLSPHKQLVDFCVRCSVH